MPDNNLTDHARLLLALVSLSGGQVNGLTRMQKLALLISKALEKDYKDIPVFDDWTPNKFGGVSTQVYLAKDELVEKGLLTEKEVRLEKEKTMKVYDLTEQGRHMMKVVPPKLQRIWEVLTSKMQNYGKASTYDLLVLSYDQYPKLAVNSTIIPEVNKQRVKKLSGLSPLFEENIGAMPSSKAGKRRERTRMLAEDEKFFRRREYEMQKLPDIAARKKMAKLVGLYELPKLDPHAIYRLRGIVAKRTPEEEFDSVELVRAVRGD
ncbi:MAG: hypothetical protein ACREAZ_09675 [Nitrososphaera sp.]